MKTLKLPKKSKVKFMLLSLKNSKNYSLYSKLLFIFGLYGSCYILGYLLYLLMS